MRNFISKYQKIIIFQSFLATISLIFANVLDFLFILSRNFAYFHIRRRFFEYRLYNHRRGKYCLWLPAVSETLTRICCEFAVECNDWRTTQDLQHCSKGCCQYGLVVCHRWYAALHWAIFELVEVRIAVPSRQLRQFYAVERVCLQWKFSSINHSSPSFPSKHLCPYCQPKMIAIRKKMLCFFFEAGLFFHNNWHLEGGLKRPRRTRLGRLSSHLFCVHRCCPFSCD